MNRVLVKRNEKINLTVKPLSNFAPKYRLSPREGRREMFEKKS